jgi:hypothetical protein
MIKLLSFLSVATLLASVGVNSAEARHRRGNCQPAPSCCQSVAPACCTPGAPMQAYADPNMAPAPLPPEQTVFVPGRPAVRGSFGADQTYPNYVYPAYRPYQARVEGYFLPKNDPRKFSVN